MKLPDFNLPWFSKWNKENPTDIYGPAILIGAGMGAIVFAVILMIFGKQVQTTSIQTGPRGAGMSVQEFNFNLAKGDPTVAGYTTSEPIIPRDGDPTARYEVENVEDQFVRLTPQNYERLFGAMREWTGIPTLFTGKDDYQDKVARRMIEMTWNINENWEGHVNASGNGIGVNCYTCHRGQPVPSDIWFKIAPRLEAAAGWAAVQNYATDQTVSTSLPHDALEKLLLDDEDINVHDLEPRVPGSTADVDDLASIQDTERTYSLMNYFAGSLGVNCTFCHNTRAFYDAEQVTPQWGTAIQGIDMVQEMNNEYLVPLKEILPPNRLGPMHGDAPKAGCRTCHKGHQKPVGGLSMTEDWPELLGEGPPDYE